MSGCAKPGTITFVLLQIARLAMVHRAINRIAARGQIGGGNRLR